MPPDAYRRALALHLRDINRAHSPNGKTYYGNAYARCLANARAAHPATDFTQPEPAMPTPKVKPPKMQVLPTNKPAPTRDLSRLHTLPSAQPGHDIAARRALITHCAERNVRAASQPGLCQHINELQAAGASLTRPGAHLGRTLLADLRNEMERRQKLAATKPVPAAPVRAGGYLAAVVATYGADGMARLQRP